MGAVRALIYLLLASGSALIGLLTLVLAQPWSPDLGPSYSPERISLAYVVTPLTIYLPATLCTYVYTRHAWFMRVPDRGRGMASYGVTSTRTLISASIIAAAYALGGLPTGLNIDLPALIASFSAVRFDPVVCLLSFTIGFYIRWAIGGAPWLPSPSMVPLIGFLDGGTWSLISFIYKVAIRPMIKRRAYRIPTTVTTMIAVHSFAWLFIYSFTLHPGPAAIAYITLALMTWHLTAVIFIIIGVLVGDSAVED